MTIMTWLEVKYSEMGENPLCAGLTDEQPPGCLASPVTTVTCEFWLFNSTNLHTLVKMKL